LLRVGTASWSIPKDFNSAGGSAGSRLERYAQVFDCVEINSSFYKPHRRATYERWAHATPPRFSFSAKIPRRISHELRLVGCSDELDRFHEEVTGLGTKLGPLLLQLPPSVEFSPTLFEFLGQLRDRFAGPVVCEPRHQSWFATDADDALKTFGIARAAVDPAIVPKAAKPLAAGDLAYIRLHGSPRVYWSPYAEPALRKWLAVAEVHRKRGDVWIVFDNTAAGSAWPDAVKMQRLALT
jgi:uncharacterized protein YecE (DUF72 family)